MGIWHTAKVLTAAWGDLGQIYLRGMRHGQSRDYYRVQARLWAARVLKTAGIDLSVEGLDKIGQGPYLIAPNHQGNLDVICILASFERLLPLFVQKREIRKMPMFGMMTEAYGNISIDRSDRRQAIGAIEDALRKVEPGQGVIMFPEGTRTKTGLMGPAKRGVFHFSVNTGIPILPVAIIGSFDRLPKDAFQKLNPGPIRLQVLDPLYPDPQAEDQVQDLLQRWTAAVSTAVGEQVKRVPAATSP